MTVLEVLVKARERISDPEKWTQGAFGRDPEGEARGIGDNGACRWCAAGAIYMNDGDLELDGAIAALERLVEAPPPTAMDGPLAYFNDTSTHEEVLTLFDRAIAIERAAESPR